MAHSPEIGAGQGFTFEGSVAAFYYAAMLAEAYAPGIDNQIVTRVSVQQASFDHPLDDVIVDFEDIHKKKCRLSLQVKQPLTISNALSNNDFRAVIHFCWKTFKNEIFRHRLDRYGAAVEIVSAEKADGLKKICDWARESITTDHFDKRFVANGHASIEHRSIKDDIVSLLNEEKGTPCSSAEVHQFLAHFVLIKFDLLREGNTQRPEAINHIKKVLAHTDREKAPLIWDKLNWLARTSAANAGQYDRQRLVQTFTSQVRFSGAPSLRPSLEKINELAKSGLALISDGIGGTRLERNYLINEYEALIQQKRFIQISGCPGTGKSVLLKKLVEKSLKIGPTLFIKADQLDQTNWIHFAQAHGLADVPLESFLLEIEATGTPIVFIDAIDRIDKNHKPLIVDLFRTINTSQQLSNWRIVATLRDLGQDELNNWLGDYLTNISLGSLKVEGLTDDDVQTLTKNNPHLSPMMYSTTGMRDIIRRPFFAKILTQQSRNISNNILPELKSEIDLLECWWRRGGYNESGQEKIDRQRAIINLARSQAKNLNQPIMLRDIQSTCIDELITDGIIQYNDHERSVRFTHDIFFEWSYFYVLAENSQQWTEEIKCCGEPPLMGRPVELTSQWEYLQKNNWCEHFSNIQSEELRSQWLRAWLLGPLSLPAFNESDEPFASLVFADDYYWLKKALVWFQAVKTIPNKNFLESEIFQDDFLHLAFYFAWPADGVAWCNFINFILKHIKTIPKKLYQDIVSIFEIWLHASGNNDISRTILNLCLEWVKTFSEHKIFYRATPQINEWDEIPDLISFKRSLVSMILFSASNVPEIAANYLNQVIKQDHISEDIFNIIVQFTPTLSKTHPQLLVDFLLAFLKEDLPEECISKAEQKVRTNRGLTQEDQFVMPFSFDKHDWNILAIRQVRGHATAISSPLSEPFYSLFKEAPSEALRLLKTLCNHAITAWRQLHRYSPDRPGTPVPLELHFPWGQQKFWGCFEEYLWCRSSHNTPDIISSGFMALEEWCFSQLEGQVPADELIRTIVEGHESIGVLGTAAMVAIQTMTMSDTTLPLITSQRILSFDESRRDNDLTNPVDPRLYGSTNRMGQQHIQAIKASSARQVRQLDLCYLLMSFVFSNHTLKNQLKGAIFDFKSNLPYEYVEDRNIPAKSNELMTEAIKYEGFFDSNNYTVDQQSNLSGMAMIQYCNPALNAPERILEAEESNQRLERYKLREWADNSLQNKAIHSAYTLSQAISLAKKFSPNELFDGIQKKNDNNTNGFFQDAVAATAATALTFAGELSDGDLKWAREVVFLATQYDENQKLERRYIEVSSYRHTLYAVKGLAADLSGDVGDNGLQIRLLKLIAHPAESISLAALEEMFILFPKDPKLAWAGLFLALSLCHYPITHDDVTSKINEAIDFYEQGTDWLSLPLPPPAWENTGVRAQNKKVSMEAKPTGIRFPTQNDVIPEGWRRPKIRWNSALAAKIIKALPYEKILHSSGRQWFLDFLSSGLNWTIQKNNPPWDASDCRDEIVLETIDWNYSLGFALSAVGGLIPSCDFISHFLEPIIKINGKLCWELLTPLISLYITRYIYNAPTITANSIEIPSFCLDKLLQYKKLNDAKMNDGTIYGLSNAQLIQDLMFIGCTSAPGAKRYANGDWSEIFFIMPIVDRFVRTSGWSAYVMEQFLILCGKAKEYYPIDDFADQVLFVMSEEQNPLRGWNGTMIPARISELIEFFAKRKPTMTPILCQKFAKILDRLTDMGDRRSASLLMSELFRGVRIVH